MSEALAIRADVVIFTSKKKNPTVRKEWWGFISF